VKCPDDMVGLSPNLTANVVASSLDNCIDITDTDNVIASPQLIDLPKGLGLLVGDPSDPDNPNKIKIADTYTSATSNHQSGRLRMGYGYFYGFTSQAEINAKFPASKFVDFFVEPRENHKYSLYEALRMLACRGEGTAWATANPSSNSTSIGNNNTVEAHVFEVRPWMPVEIATIKWMAMAPPEFSVYLPFYGSLITDVFDMYYYKEDAIAYNNANPDDNTVYWVFRELYAQCAATNLTDRERFGNGVRDFWERYQKSLIEQQAYIDETMLKVLARDGQEAAEKWATDITLTLAEDTYNYAKQMLAELKAFKAAGTTGSFIPSALLDENATPRYAELFVILDDAVPAASVEKLNGNKNNLTVTVTEYFSDGSENCIKVTFSIDNNAAGTYNVGGYKVYVDTKGNTQIRDCRIV